MKFIKLGSFRLGFYRVNCSTFVFLCKGIFCCLDIPTDILIKLAKFHHVSTDYLLGLTNQKEPYISKGFFKERERSR